MGLSYKSSAGDKKVDASFELATGINSRDIPIVGIVRDFHSLYLQKAINPFFFGTEKDWENNISIRLTPTARIPEAINTMPGKTEKIWHEIYPNGPFKYSFFEESIANLYSRERHLSGLLSQAMIIAISISCMGLLGVASFGAQQRRKEMSIRRVLGASAGQINI